MPLRYVAAVLACCAAAPSAAQTVPLVWNFGSLHPAAGFGPAKTVGCNTDGGLSSLALNASGTSALLALNDLNYYTPTAGGDILLADFAGIARLQFTSATGGDVYFDIWKIYKGKLPPVRFSGYAATYSATDGTLSLSLVLQVAKCQLPLKAIYRTP
jgi:hypothetical protein